MTKELLAQYSELKEEIKDLQRRIQNIKTQIAKLEAEGTVLDSVKGSRRDGTIGCIRIEGFPYPEYRNKVKRLYEYKNQLEKSQARSAELVQKVEEYINSVKDSRIRKIIRFKYIDGLSWNGVACKMGGNNTEDSIRMALTRFLEKN